MTRGKYSASAAKARAATWQERAIKAESAAREWKRIAQQHESNAARADSLERALKQSRAEIGVPVHMHDQLLAQQNAEWQAKWDAAINHFGNVIWGLVVWVPQGTGVRWLSIGMLEAMKGIPELGDLLLRWVNLPRVNRRPLTDSRQISKMMAVDSVRKRELAVIRRLIGDETYETRDDICHVAVKELERLQWIGFIADEGEVAGRDMTEIRRRVAELQEDAVDVRVSEQR